MNERSYLFVPGDRPERFARALASGADAVIFDLEDAVAAERKATARLGVARWLGEATSEQRRQAVVRINDDATPWHADDLAALQVSRPAAVMLPKTESAAQVTALHQALAGIAVLALIESARGVLAAAPIAAAAQRLVFGTIDFALDLDIAPEPEGLAHAAAALVLASRAAGLPAPVAGVTTAIDDEALLLADFAWARRLGFGAKLCIHPKQVAPLHAALRPGDAELAWARRVLAAADASKGAAVQVDGRMVDKPVLQRARRLLDRAA